MLSFENVRLLSYEHTPTITEGGLRYRINKALSIQGTMLASSNLSGVSILEGKEQNIIAGATDYDDIILNGVNFGQGRITKINFQGGNLVRREDYSYDIECFEDGNLSNAATGVYAGITWASLFTSKIDSFSEEFSATINEQNDQQFSHSVSIKYLNVEDGGDPLALAKSLASMFFNAYSGIGAFINNLQNYHAAKKLYTETYNLSDYSCSFVEAISVPSSAVGTTYSYELQYDLKLDEAGFLMATEQISIVGLTNPKNAGAEQGYSDLISNTYSRASTVATIYDLSPNALNSVFLQQSRNSNKFTGKIQVSTTYSNNPKYNTNVSWVYSTELTRDDNGNYTVSEKGEIIGLGRAGFDKYALALAFFNSTVAPGYVARLLTSYNRTGRSLPLKLVKQTLEKNQFQGTISYSYTETDNKLYENDTFKSVSIQTTLTNPVPVAPKYKIFNFAEIIQPQGQSTLGEKSIVIKIKGSRAQQITDYLTYAKTTATTYIPAGQGDSFLKDCQYTFVPETNDFSLTCVFSFTGIKLANDLTVT